MPTLLIVGMGERGGVGRYERLLCSAAQRLADTGELRFHAEWLRDHP